MCSFFATLNGHAVILTSYVTIPKQNVKSENASYLRGCQNSNIILHLLCMLTYTQLLALMSVPENGKGEDLKIRFLYSMNIIELHFIGVGNVQGYCFHLALH